MAIINAIERPIVNMGGITLGVRRESVQRYVRTVGLEIDSNKVVEMPEYREGLKFSLFLRRTIKK